MKGFSKNSPLAGLLAIVPCSTRRRRGRILRDVPRPDADRRITARSDSHPISLMGAKRSGASVAWRIDRTSRGSCYAGVEKLWFATWDGSPKGGDAGRCFGGSVDDSPAAEGGSPQGLSGD
jgi:hypothetical protein